jgi:Fe2+ or Zn2+ uptake regulation protein
VKERRTRQLRAVYATVRDAVDHPTADEVHARVRRRMAAVSLGTVYRNLQKLAAQQHVRVLRLANRAARYDAIVEPHDHFVCERCGAVADVVRGERVPAGAAIHLTRAGYRVRSQELTFYGLCPRCGADRRSTRRRQGGS